VLLEEQLVRVLSGPGQPDRKVVAEPPQLIVPATSTKRQRQAGQAGVLFTEQLRNQIRGDLIFSVRHSGDRSPGTTAVDRVRAGRGTPFSGVFQD
jgi:hypothetical protein